MHQIHHFDELCSIGKKILLPKGQCLQELSDRADKDVFALASGICALTKMTEEGEERTFMYFTPNWMLRLVPICLQDYHSEHWSMNIYTRTPCCIYKIQGTAFLELLSRRPMLAESALKILAYNLVSVQSNFFDRQDLSAFLRLCKLLLELDRGSGIPSFFTAEELGNFIGTHQVTVARIISELKKRNIVERKGRQLIITDRPSLLKILRERIVYDY